MPISKKNVEGELSAPLFTPLTDETVRTFVPDSVRSINPAFFRETERRYENLKVKIKAHVARDISFKRFFSFFDGQTFEQNVKMLRDFFRKGPEGSKLNCDVSNPVHCFELSPKEPRYNSEEYIHDYINSISLDSDGELKYDRVVVGTQTEKLYDSYSLPLVSRFTNDYLKEVLEHLYEPAFDRLYRFVAEDLDRKEFFDLNFDKKVELLKHYLRENPDTRIVLGTHEPLSRESYILDSAGDIYEYSEYCHAICLDKGKLAFEYDYPFDETFDLVCIEDINSDDLNKALKSVSSVQMDSILALYKKDAGIDWDRQIDMFFCECQKNGLSIFGMSYNCPVIPLGFGDKSKIADVRNLVGARSKEFGEINLVLRDCLRESGDGIRFVSGRLLENKEQCRAMLDSYSRKEKELDIRVTVDRFAFSIACHDNLLDKRSWDVFSKDQIVDYMKSLDEDGRQLACKELEKHLSVLCSNFGVKKDASSLNEAARRWVFGNTPAKKNELGKIKIG